MSEPSRPISTDERPTCACCGNRLAVQWSDTHGVGVCTSCGLPYRLYHYENDKRVEKPAEPCLTARGVEIAKEYWTETHRRVFPACYDMGIGRDGRSYSGATSGDCDAFNTWYVAKGYDKEAA